MNIGIYIGDYLLFGGSSERRKQRCCVIPFVCFRGLVTTLLVRLSSWASLVLLHTTSKLELVAAEDAMVVS